MKKTPLMLQCALLVLGGCVEAQTARDGAMDSGAEPGRETEADGSAPAGDTEGDPSEDETDGADVSGDSGAATDGGADSDSAPDDVPPQDDDGSSGGDDSGADDSGGDTSGGGDDTGTPTAGDAETGDAETGGVEEFCGDAIVGAGEVCDDGINDGEYGGCAIDCSALAAHCGDGILDAVEACDDGINDGAYGGCASDCSALAAYCGDGIVQPAQGEACDDGTNDSSYDGCMGGCAALGPHCGDGVTQPGQGEACDDGNDTEFDACNTSCIEAGAEIWSNMYSSPSPGANDRALAVAVNANGTILVTGELDRNGAEDAWVRWYSADGTIDSTHQPNFVMRDVEFLDADTYVGFTHREGAVSGPTDRSTVRAYTGYHEALWYEHVTERELAVLSLDSSSRIVAAGTSLEWSGWSATRDPYFAQLSADGGVLWSEDLSTPSATGRCRAITTDAADNVFVHCDGRLHKYTPDGSTTWDVPLAYSVQDLVVTNDGNIVAATPDTFVRLDQNGDLDVELAVSHDMLSILQTPEDHTIAFGRFGGDIRIARYDADGGTLWTQTWDGGGNGVDAAVDGALMPDGSLVTVGYTDRSDLGQGDDVWVAVLNP